jgi:ADP-ribose pyrophosphatase YjhB (NUDIX family)
MRVKARAVVVRDGRLLVSRERRRGTEHVLLPGGRVRNGESITEALVREVAEETGLDVFPDRLLYVAEVVGSYGAHDLDVIWLAQPRDPASVGSDSLVAFDSPLAASIMPPIVDRIAVDAERGWPSEPRWLGNLRRAPTPDAPVDQSASHPDRSPSPGQASRGATSRTAMNASSRYKR